MFPEILMLLVSCYQNNFQDNLGIILPSISYIITNQARHVAQTNKHSSQTKWSPHPLTTQLNIPARQFNRAETDFYFLIPAGRIQWKLFIIKPEELQGFQSCRILLGRLDLFWF